MKKLLLSAFVGTTLVAYSPASAMYTGGPAYHTTFYNNSSHSTQVGFLMWDGCDGDTPTYHLVGHQTSFHDDELIGYCIDGVMYPA